jgi:hypothetical protein
MLLDVTGCYLMLQIIFALAPKREEEEGRRKKVTRLSTKVEK